MDSNQEKAIDLITQAAELMGWQIAIPGGPEVEETDEIKYMIIGTPNAIEKITDILEDEEDLTYEPTFH